MGSSHEIKRFRPEEIANAVLQLEPRQVVAVVVFGSVARGDEDEQSDLDVLIVVDDLEARRALLRRLRSNANPDFHPLVLTRTSLQSEVEVRPSFVAHLLDEGVVAYATPEWPSICEWLASFALDKGALGREVRSRARDLEPLAKAERFRKSPVTALSHIYGIARSIVIVRLLEEGIHEYSWQRAFDRYAEVRPELRSELEALKALRPYYEYARSRAGARLPERILNAERVRELVGAAEQLTV